MSTLVQKMGEFVARSSYEDLSAEARAALKARMLDSLGCALGALDGETTPALKGELGEFGGRALCTVLGAGRTAPDRAAFYNGSLVRYLDFNDSYLAKDETCHPSDNLAAVLAAAEHVGASGRELLTALAVAYQVQCRLSDVAPVRDRGFDHTTHLAYSVAAGVARALGLDAERTAHAIAIAGASLTALRITRTGALSNWKGLAAPAAAFGATHAAYLARRGITGPLGIFEGNKGLFDAITGPFSIDWSQEDLERVRATALKRFNAEVHAQSAIEAALELTGGQRLAAEQVERVEVDVFGVAYRIIGGGEEGDKRMVETKEQADHSLPYMLAAALLDGRLMPEQYRRERILRSDVQSLLRRVVVRESPELSARFPREHACRLRLVMRDGAVREREKHDYEGFPTRPMPWERVVAKFHALGAAVPERARARIVETVQRLEDVHVSELCKRLSDATPGQPQQEVTPSWPS